MSHTISDYDLVKTMDKKSHKKKCEKKNDCQIVCALPDCNPDCCTAAFQRLDKLRNYWILAQNGLILTSPIQLNPSDPQFNISLADPFVPTTIYTRSGLAVNVPLNDVVVPGILVDGPGPFQFWGTLERQAFAFVNTVRYLNYEECGKLDQVIGWSVNVQNGNLYLYQDLPELGLNSIITSFSPDNRLALINEPISNLTPQERKKLIELNNFYRLSLKAIERVRENPKTEGNICEIKDKHGNRYLIAVNRTSGQYDNNPQGIEIANALSRNNGQFAGGVGYAAAQAAVADFAIFSQIAARLLPYYGNSVSNYNSSYSIIAVKIC